jgi:hypothetical protein
VTSGGGLGVEGLVTQPGFLICKMEQ